MTGDVVQQETPNRVVWIDRKKNVLKLSQGEFVSLGRLEAVYKGGSALIHQARGPAGRSACLPTLGPPLCRTGPVPLWCVCARADGSCGAAWARRVRAAPVLRWCVRTAVGL
jgi:hypothetical protein